MVRSNPYVDQFMSAMRMERERLATRRSVLTSTAKLAGAGAAAAVLSSSDLRQAVAQEFEDDVEILNYLLTLEHLEYAFYREGLNEFGLLQFQEADQPESLYPQLQQVRTHEASHVNALSGAVTDLEGEAVEEAEYDFDFEDIDSFLMTARALENTGVAAYAGVAPQIQDDEILATVLSIHSVEARHAAFLNEENDESPFPTAFDEAMSSEEVLEVTSDFVVDSAVGVGGDADEDDEEDEDEDESA